MPATAQYTSPIAQGARSGALGGSVLYLPEESGVELGYRRGFMLDALSERSLSLRLRAGSGGLLAAYSHQGDADWHGQQATFGYGLPLTEWLHAAVALRWLHRGLGDAHYDSHFWLAPSALLQATFGRTTFTLLGGTRPWDEEHPWRLHLQAAYRPLPHLLTLAEVETEEAVRLRLGMEYNYEAWYLRAGMATRPTVLAFGIGMRQQHLGVDLACEVHSVLGITPQTSLSLWF